MQIEPELPDWIVIDLWLPAHGLPNGGVVRGAEVGLRAVADVLAMLGQRSVGQQSVSGMAQRVLIVSGNVSIRVKGQLVGSFRVPAEQIFDKPLSEVEENRLRDLLLRPR